MAISFNNLRNMTESGLNYRNYLVGTGGTIFSANRAISNIDLWADTGMAVGDYLIWTCLGQANKPRGMRFDVSTAIVSVGRTGVWEYRLNDGTWATFAGLVDATNGFGTAGTNLDVTWTVPTDWGCSDTSVNGTGGALWWRYRITALTSYTEGGRLGNTTPATTQVYDNAIRVEDNDQYDSGTATSSNSTFTLTDTSKAFAVNILRGRLVYIHTGTGAGQFQMVTSNTATVISMIDYWVTPIDTTSQYVILSNFEDIYQADLAGGWGVVTRAGIHSYGFNCYLDFRAGAFGDTQVNVEFMRNYMFYTVVAHTSRYPFSLGWRPPLVYGLDKGLFGVNIICNKDTVLDERSSGFLIATEFLFTAGNRFVQRFDMTFVAANAFLRRWFNHSGKFSINEIFEGWRSITMPKNTTPRTEFRNGQVIFGHSGIENNNASMSKIVSYFHASLSYFITGVNNFILPNMFLGLTNTISGVRTIAPIAFFAYTGTATKLIDVQPRFRPMQDIYLSNSTGRTQKQVTIRALITDEFNKPLENATMRISDSLDQNRFNVLNFDIVDDNVSVSNNSANQFSGSTAFSVEAWVNNRSTGEGAVGRILDKGSGSSVGYHLFNDVTSWRFRVYTSSGTFSSNTSGHFINTWQHIVGVWTGSQIILYVNGVATSPNGTTGTATNDTGHSLFFGNNSATSNTFDGFIRRVRLFRNVGLSAANVATLRDGGDFTQNQTSPVAGCTGEYNFTEGSGLTLADTSGNGNTATIPGSPNTPLWYNTNTGLTTQNFTLTTGLVNSFLGQQAVTLLGSYSLTTQPTVATRLRLTISAYADSGANASNNARVVISGTDADSNVIQEVFFLEEFGKGSYETENEFLTVSALGLVTTGWVGTMSVDKAGRIDPQRVDVESWSSPNDIQLLTAIHNPITLKITAPGYDPVTIKKTIHEKQDLHIAMKRSVLDLT